MGMQHTRYVIIGDIGPAPGEEANILQPVQGLTLITFAQPLTVFPKHKGAHAATGAAGFG